MSSWFAAGDDGPAGGAAAIGRGRVLLCGGFDGQAWAAGGQPRRGTTSWSGCAAASPSAPCVTTCPKTNWPPSSARSSRRRATSRPTARRASNGRPPSRAQSSCTARPKPGRRGINAGKVNPWRGGAHAALCALREARAFLHGAPPATGELRFTDEKPGAAGGAHSLDARHERRTDQFDRGLLCVACCQVLGGA